MKKFNVEIKAACEDVGKIREILGQLGAFFKGQDHQIDTYFNIPQGRLKLRKGNIENSLIYYSREESQGMKDSHIVMERLEAQNHVQDVLAEALGVKIIVDKKREIYFVDHVKFHLDEVSSLGNFVEIEVIDDSGLLDKKEMQAMCQHYLELFGIEQSSCIAASYSDLLIEKKELWRKELEGQAQTFVHSIEKECLAKGLEIKNLAMDHLCFRVTNQDDYQKYKSILSLLGNCLSESIVSGRPIATYKLAVPFTLEQRSIDVIELPAPKDGSFYSTGFEHAECIVQSLGNFPERIFLTQGKSVKFHSESLESIILKEQQCSAK